MSRLTSAATKANEPGLCARLLRGFELIGVKFTRCDANRTVAFDGRTKFQAVQSDFELHQFRPADFADGFQCLRQLVLADPRLRQRLRRGKQFANLHRIPCKAAWFAFQQVSPSGGRSLLRQEQERPRFRRGGVVGLAKRWHAISRRTLRRVRQHINAEPVGEVIVFVIGAIDRFLQRNEPGQLCKHFRRFQGRVQFFEFGEE